MSKVLQTFSRNTRIHHMLVIEGSSCAVAAAVYGISRMRAMQIACHVAGTRTLTEARAKFKGRA